MIKVIFISFIATGIVGAGANTLAPAPLKPAALTPDVIELTTGSVKIKAAQTGITTSMAHPDGLALSLKTKSGFRIRLRF